MLLQLHLSIKLQFTVINDAAIAIVKIAEVADEIVDAVAVVNAFPVLKDNAVADINNAAVAVVEFCCSCSCQ